MAINYDLTVVKGDTIRWSNFFYDVSGNTFDFRGCTLYMQVRLGGYNNSKLITEYSRYIPTVQNFQEPYGYTGGLNTLSVGTAYFCIGSTYSSLLDTSRPYNYDVKVYSPTTKSYTTIIRGNIYSLPNASDYVNYTTGTYAAENLAEPTSALDYEVWANHFVGNAFFNTSLEERYRWGTSGYVFLGIVPAILMAGNSYNGWRGPTTTDISDVNTGNETLAILKTRMQTIPSGRRCFQAYYYWNDCNIFTKEHQKHYRGTADGTTYSGSTFTTIWTDVNLSDAKTSFTALLNNMYSSGVTFDYLIDDKEEQGYWHLGGYNSYNSWGTALDINGYPTDPYPTLNYTRPMPDARVMSALFADSRFSSYVNPESGKTFGGEFLSNYKNMIGDQGITLTPQQILKRVIGNTGATNYLPPSLWWQPWAGDINYKGYTGGFTFFTCAAPAWEATVDSFMHGYYIKNLFDDTLSNVTGFENTKHVQYEIYPTSHVEAQYLQKSNSERRLQSPIPTTYSGDAFYGLLTNIVFPAYLSICGSNFQSGFDTRSGYVTNPGSTMENYGWCGYQVSSYPNSSLVRYPETNPCTTGNFGMFYKELSFKVIVNHLMFLRGSFRSDSTFWERFTPWIGDSYYGIFNEYSGVGRAYWYELFYHLCLHGAKFFNYFDMTYNPYKTNDIQTALDSWRFISNNSRATPCSNSTGNTNLPVDRLLLKDVFQKVLISGGRLSNGKYLWRITLSPQFIDERGNATLVRVGSDSDIPEYIEINSSDIKNSCGVWITRSVSTPPEYTPVPR